MSNQSRWLLVLGGVLAVAAGRLSGRGRRSRPASSPGVSRDGLMFAPPRNATTRVRPAPTPLPCRREREHVLSQHLPNGSSGADLDIALLARLTPGYGFPELERLATRLHQLAATETRTPTMSDAARVLEELARHDGDRPRLLEPEERRRVANLVAGHVTAAWWWDLIDGNVSVSILDDNVARTLTVPPARRTSGMRDTYFHSIAALDTLLAGPIAHELLSGEGQPSIDEVLLHAIVLATQVAGWQRSAAAPAGRKGGPSNSYHVSDSFREDFPSVAMADEWVRSLLDKRKVLVRERLLERLPQLHQLALLFVEDERVDAPTLSALLQPVPN